MTNIQITFYSNYCRWELIYKLGDEGEHSEYYETLDDAFARAREIVTTVLGNDILSASQTLDRLQERQRQLLGGGDLNMKNEPGEPGEPEHPEPDVR